MVTNGSTAVCLRNAEELESLWKRLAHLPYFWQHICYQWNVKMTVVWPLRLLQTELLMKLLSCGSVVIELKVLSCVRLWDVCGASGLTGLVLPYIYEPACLFQYFITVWFYCWQSASIRYLAIFSDFTVMTDWKNIGILILNGKHFLLKQSNLIILAELVKIVPRTLREHFSNYCVTFRVITLTSEVITLQKLLWHSFGPLASLSFYAHTLYDP